MRGRPSTRRVGAWLRLLRVPNLLTVPGDPVAGAFLAAGFGHHVPVSPVAWAALATMLLYAAGLLLNDWADRAEDARERPGRPLPSGAVDPRHVLAAMAGCAAGGLLAASAAGPATLGLSVCLLGLVALYNLAAKRGPAGPWVMGACRAVSLLMGAAAVCGGRLVEHPPVAGASAALLGYVAMVTCAARTETAKRRNTWAAVPAVAVLGTGLAALAALAPGRASAAAWPAGILAFLWAAVAACRWRMAGPAAIGGLLGALPFWQAFLVGVSGSRASAPVALSLILAGFLSALLRRHVAAS